MNECSNHVELSLNLQLTRPLCNVSKTMANKFFIMVMEGLIHSFGRDFKRAKGVKCREKLLTEVEGFQCHNSDLTCLSAQVHGLKTLRDPMKCMKGNMR